MVESFGEQERCWLVFLCREGACKERVRDKANFL